jgi:hypothetical protein
LSLGIEDSSDLIGDLASAISAALIEVGHADQINTEHGIAHDGSGTVSRSPETDQRSVGNVGREPLGHTSNAFSQAYGARAHKESQQGAEALGEQLPRGDEHAVGVSMPLWADVVRYEEGDKATLDRLAGGYPRFMHIILTHHTPYTKVAILASYSCGRSSC